MSILAPLMHRARTLLGLSHFDVAGMCDLSEDQVRRAEAGGGHPHHVLQVFRTLTDPLDEEVARAVDVLTRPHPLHHPYPTVLDIARVHGPLHQTQVVDRLLVEPYIVASARPPGLVVVTDPSWARDGGSRAWAVAEHLSEHHGPTYQAQVGARVSYLVDPSLIRVTSWHPQTSTLNLVGPALTPLTLLGRRPGTRTPTVGWPLHVYRPRLRQLMSTWPLGGLWAPTEFAAQALLGTAQRHRHLTTSCSRISLLLGTTSGEDH